LGARAKPFQRFLQIMPARKYENLYFNLFAFKFFKNSENRNILLFGISRLANPLIVIPYILGFELINFRRKRYFVRLETHVVGTFVLSEKPEALYIGTLTVNPQYRNLGVATFILTYAERLAMRMKKKWLELSVLKVNNAALRLFEKFGFVKKEDEKRFFTLRKKVKTQTAQQFSAMKL
jgi:ribosomal protein S18 acetylase RimI-like enzyme